MERLTIRRATPSDKKAVLDIRDDVYDGRDYLSCYYDNFMESKEHASYLAEIEGKTVAFCSRFLVDEGRTVISRAGRTNPMYSGEGVYIKLMSTVLAESGATVNASSLVDANPAVTKPTFLKDNHQILSRPFFRYSTRPEDIKISTEFTNVPAVGDDLLEEFITDDSFRNYLFPCGRIIVDWVPFQLLTSNIRLIREAGIHLTILSNVQHVEGWIRGVLFVCSKYSRNDTDFYALDVYGADLAAFRECISHVMASIVDTSSKHIDIMVFFEPSMDGDKIEKVMNEFGQRKLVWNDPKNGLPYSKQIIFEKRLP